MDIPLLTALADKMRWHQARQKLLAENVANAETPGFRGQDLSPFSFEGYMRNQTVAKIETATTRPGHIGVTGTGADGFGPRATGGFEITPEGNSVTLEDEMMKVASNQMDYQAITSLYTRSLRLIRTALGKDA
jgi:flagellar basal-body rod protein FlgB